MTEIRIVGTAHVSQKSIEDVHREIHEFQPDVVAVELDPARYEALKSKETPEQDVSEVLRAGNFGQLAVQWVFAYLQRRIGQQTGVEPGAEMMAAIQTAEEEGIPAALIDRDIRITLTRFWRKMRLMEKIKLVFALIVSLAGIGGQEIDVESLTDQDVISAALEEFRSICPGGTAALIDERDAFIAHRLLSLAMRHDRVLAVVGAGHRAGIERYLADPSSLPPMNALTAEVKTRPWAQIIGVAVIVVFALFLAAIAFSGVGLDVLLTALLYWVLINGILAAGFTLAAGGHPLSAVTAFGVSWMTSLNPLLAAGWFAAIVEAKIRRPGTSDVRRIFAAETFAEMRKIPLFRVVLVAALANVGSTIGTIAYFVFIFPLLGIDPATVITAGFGNLWQGITGG
ncbi:MAG: TraB/GumN family protein [Methanomicrobiales archaeon]